MTEHALIMCREPGRHSTLDKGHEEGYQADERAKNPPAMRETWVRSLGKEDPLEGGMATHSSILAWRIPMDREARWATVHGVEKSQTQLRD